MAFYLSFFDEIHDFKTGKPRINKQIIETDALQNCRFEHQNYHFGF